MSRKLKTAVIREELVALTGHYMSALILNQFIYWSERTRDTDQYLQEEQRRMKADNTIQPTHGWIYKNAQEMAEELMVDCTAVTIRKYIKPLVDNGYLDERTNPLHHWDRTLQYRPNMVKIQTALSLLGYSLEGYPLQVTNYDGSNLNNLASSKNNLASSLKDLGALPETTTETTTEIVEQAPTRTRATADDMMPAHLRGWLENNQPATGELVSTDQAMENLESSAPHRAAIIQASRDKRVTGKNATPLREAAQRAYELGFTPERILAAFSTNDGSFWRDSYFGRNGDRPYIINICDMIDEAASAKQLTPDQLKAIAYIQAYQQGSGAKGWVNGAGDIARAATRVLLQSGKAYGHADIVKAVLAHSNA